MAAYDSSDHRFESHSRIAEWLADLPAADVRQRYVWERFCRFAREAEPRLVASTAPPKYREFYWMPNAIMAFAQQFPGCTGRRIINRQIATAAESHVVKEPAPMGISQLEMQSAKPATSGLHQSVAVLVVGMHRSGTSALSGMLNYLGVIAPGELQPANEFNQKGFFENLKIIALNEHILEQLGSRWDDPLPLGQDCLGSPTGYSAAKRLSILLREEIGDQAMVVVKDPRICRLVPLWLEALSLIGRRTVAVMPFRRPLEVVASLQRRESFSGMKAMILWLEYILAGERATRGLTRCYVLYDELLQNWRWVAQKIGKELELKWPIDRLRVENDIDAFLSSDLQHHRALEGNLILQDGLYALCSRAFEALLLLSADAYDVSAQAILDQISRDLTAAIGVLGPLVADLDRGLLHAQRQVAVQTHNVAALGQQLVQEAQQAAAQREQLEHQFDAEAAHRAQLEHQLDAEAAHRAQLEHQLDAEAARREQLEHQHDAEAAGRKQAEQGLQSETERHRLTRQTYQEQLDAAEHRREADVADMRARADFLQHQLYAIEASTLWRITASLRLPSSRISRLAHALKRAWARTRTTRWAARAIVHKLRTDPYQIMNSFRIAVHAIRTRKAIAASGLFDAAWYTATNSDVAATGVDPLWHFVRRGAAEKRRASALFDTRWYLKNYPDVAASGINPLLHYIQTGAAAGLDPNPFFDSDWYLQQYPDVAAAGGNPLLHYQKFGAAEGRLPSINFDPQAYMQFHSDVPGGKARALHHFLHTQTEAPTTIVSRPATLPGSATHFGYQPLISVIMPVFNVAPEWLRCAIASVQAQTYLNWELCVCDDGSTTQQTIEALAELEREEPRLHITRLSTNLGISRASNEALALAKGEFVALLDNDDELALCALATFVAELNRDDGIDVLYSDEDKLNENGEREDPFFKPDWSPILLRQVMYVGHLLVVRRSLIEKVGGFNSIYDGVQDFELMLRLAEHTRNIHHVRKILYHWRRIPGSIADCIDAKPGLAKRQVAAVNAHLLRLGINALAEPHPALAHRAVVKPLGRQEHPKVSIIIPTKNAPAFISRCLDSIYTTTGYPNFEVVVVDNETTDREALAAIKGHPVIQVPFRGQFNFSRANNAGAAAATGEIFVLLNNDTEILCVDWIEQMLFLLDDPDVAAVGPMLLYPDGTVQHAGVALGLRGTADHVLRGAPADADGYFGSLACTREVSAVTFACVMIRRSDYEALGGLQDLYGTHYQDVDFCLRLREQGKRILYTPRTCLIHHESVTRGSAYDSIDRALLLDTWGTTISSGDPYSRWERAARADVGAA